MMNMEYNDLDCDIETGILIYQLPNELVGKAKEVLPRAIKRTFIDEYGLRVYFSKPNVYNEWIRRKFIVLDEILFYIYSTVTCLTVSGISSFASVEETIKSRVEAKGMHVFNLFRILNTNDYRIILNVPEVLANFEMSPISLDSDCRKNCPIAFYCRVCRREGHKQYQCQQLMKEMRGPEDTGNTSGRTSSNSARNSKQGNAVNPSVSGGTNKGIQSLGNSSARGYASLPVWRPNTSNMRTAAEALTKINSNITTRSKKVAPETARKRHVTSVKKGKRGRKHEYPCNEIVKIIMEVSGILTPRNLCAFLEEVRCKKKLIPYAQNFTQNIPQLINQIRSVISHCNEENCGSSIAKKDVKILEDLCQRLDSQFKI